MEGLKKYVELPHLEESELAALIEERSKVALKGVESMSKHPLSLKQKIAQRDRIDGQIKAMQSIKK
ncbi:MAG TPA: hypothetical protein PLN24_08975 [Victivallales bacterium]|nr:hypothetical protein [Victivallales bacterium]HOK05371.1 hypothetical protein [Victivallales bacterium]